MVSIGFDKYDKVKADKRPGRLAGACIAGNLEREPGSASPEGGYSGVGSRRKTRAPVAV